ncbi:MAG: phosphoribosyltransferase family protein [Candidatus Acidiferrum sp.]|jgi:orotate phosphoribosyltransferase
MKEDVLPLVEGRRGHFQLESGHHGDLWLPLEALCLRPREMQPFVVRLTAALRKYEVQMVCGPLVEGAYIALLVSLELDCDFVYAERFANPSREGLFPVSYRLPKALHGAVRGQRVAIVNDVISAGSAVRGALRDLQCVGAEVVAIGALLGVGDSIGKFAAENHVALELLQQRPHHVWTPEECPLCAAGVAIEIASNS